MKPEKKMWEKLRKAEELAKGYLSNERDYIALESQYHRAIRDAYVAGYRKAMETEDDTVPFWQGPRERVDSEKLHKQASRFNNRLLTIKEVASKLGISRGTVWRMTRDGTFPPKVSITGRSVRWRESEVDEWISRKVASNNQASRQNSAS
jgi:prophage regulatory protein